MLLFYNMMLLARPDTTGRRVGYIMINVIQSFLQPMACQHSAIDINFASRQIHDWGVYGYKLNILCAEIGAGCIFALTEHLSPDL